MKAVVFGNCQARPLARFLQIAAPQIEILEVPPVYSADRSKPAIFHAQFRQADVVLGQPVSPAFGALSTEALQAESPQATWISFPSIYFGGHFPYLRTFKNGAAIQTPLAQYHDVRIIRAFLNGLSEQDCLQELHKVDEDWCRSHYHAAIAESYRREEYLDIRIMDFFLAIQAEERTFFTFNHPSNRILWQIALAFLDRLGIRPVEGARPYQAEALDRVKAAILPEVEAIAGLRFRQRDHQVAGRLLPPETLIARCYAVYRKLRNFDVLCARNGIS